MMEDATFNRLAERELAEAIEFYEGARLGRGEEFLGEVAYGDISWPWPEAIPRVDKKARRFLAP